MPDALIRFSNVYKSFGPKLVFADLNLSIVRGEALTIVGGSGVGKSVMLKLLIGLLKADRGSIMFEGQEITTMRESQLGRVRQRIGMLFQSGALFDSLTVEQNVAYGLEEHFHQTMSKRDIRERVAASLSAVGLPGIEAMSTADLSGGMRRRVSLARAIAVQPEVLLYDEPTTGLDPINTARINHLIVRLKESLKITSVVVTHDMKSAFATSDRIVMVQGGRTIYQGSPDEFRNCADPRVADFVQGQAPKDEDVETLLNA
jgi:phospholipid/cholesterol/gamma-HCH transport system ATP-binding protein